MIPDLPVYEVAPMLLGARVITMFGGMATEVTITEVEAYGGHDDPASHAFVGRTRRNRSMFARAGTLYVYRSYGVHWCANVVTGQEGTGEAVLLRAGIPLVGEETMRDRRGRVDHLCDGPGRLCQALGITGDADGTSLESGPVRLVPTEEPVRRVIATPRVGITKATDRLWRFLMAG